MGVEQFVIMFSRLDVVVPQPEKSWIELVALCVSFQIVYLCVGLEGNFNAADTRFLVSDCSQRRKFTYFHSWLILENTSKFPI